MNANLSDEFSAALETPVEHVDVDALPDFDQSDLDALPDLPVSAEFDQALVGDAPTASEVSAIAKAFTAAEHRQIVSRVPVLKRTERTLKWRQWQIDTGSVFGPAGGETVITLTPNQRFRCEKVMATDDYSGGAGMGTRIVSVTVGNKVQLVDNQGNGTLTAFFAAQALANGITFDTASPWATIQIRVRFPQQCNFDLTLMGTVAVEDDVE